MSGDIILTKGKLDGLMLSPLVKPDGTLQAVDLDVDTLPGLQMRLDASAAEELWYALGVVLGKRPETVQQVYEASLTLRRIEAAEIPGESIAEIEANSPAAQRRTALALMAWRSVIDLAIADEDKSR